MAPPSLLLHNYRAFARYNAGFNRQLYAVVAALSPEQRTRDLGAFFGSIEGTLQHILLADRVWLGRFRNSGHDFPALEEAELIYEIHSLRDPVTEGFAALDAERIATDQVIMAWVEDLDDDVLAATLAFTTTQGQPYSMPMWTAVSHLFNHQAHHRGQVTTLLRQLGHDPGATDFLEFVLPKGS